MAERASDAETTLEPTGHLVVVFHQTQQEHVSIGHISGFYCWVAYSIPSRGGIDERRRHHDDQLGLIFLVSG